MVGKLSLGTWTFSHITAQRKGLSLWDFEWSDRRLVVEQAYEFSVKRNNGAVTGELAEVWIPLESGLLQLVTSLRGQIWRGSRGWIIETDTTRLGYLTTRTYCRIDNHHDLNNHSTLVMIWSHLVPHSFHHKVESPLTSRCILSPISQTL